MDETKRYIATKYLPPFVTFSLENGRSFLVCCSPRPYPPHSLEQFRGRGEVFHTRRISFSIPWQKASSFAPNGIIKMAIKDLESISLPSRGETMESFSKVSQTSDELRTKLKLCQSYPGAIYSRSTVASFRPWIPSIKIPFRFPAVSFAFLAATFVKWPTDFTYNRLFMRSS